MEQPQAEPVPPRPEGFLRAICKELACYFTRAFGRSLPGDNDVYVGFEVFHTDWPDKQGSLKITITGNMPGDLSLDQAEALRDALDRAIQLAKDPPQLSCSAWKNGG